MGAILLTGGASTRLGRDKATLAFGDSHLADHLAKVLVSICSPVIEVGPGVTSLPSVREDPPLSGPLAAIAAGWEAIRKEGLIGAVVMACDLPRVDAALLAMLAVPGQSSCVPVVRGRPQYLCARYSAQALDNAGTLLERGRRSVASLAAAAAVDLPAERRWCAITSAEAFSDIDRPEDLWLLGRQPGPHPGSPRPTQ